MPGAVRARGWILLGGATALAAAIGCSSQGASSCGNGSSCTTDRGQYHPPDAPDAAQGLACYPADLSSFTPVPIAPLVKHVCTDAQIHAIAQACSVPDSVPGGADRCGQAMRDPANQACIDGNCIFTAYSPVPATLGVNPIPAAQGPWGPLVSVRGTVSQGEGIASVNLGACVALSDPSRPDCAQTSTARYQCDTAACVASCPPATIAQTQEQQVASSSAYSDCIARAEATSGACQSFVDVDNGCRYDLVNSHSPAAFCYTDFASGDPAVVERAYEKLMKLQCGLPTDGSTCMPADVPGFQPAPIDPRIMRVCTDAQLQAFAESCLGLAATASACSQWTGDSANLSCFGCFQTSYSSTPMTPGAPVPPAAGPWGPLVRIEGTKVGGYILYNPAGCILATDPASAECAYAWEALYECEVTACAGTCALPIWNDPQAAATTRIFGECLDQANVGPCEAYYNASRQKCGRIMAANSLDAGASSPAGFCLNNSIWTGDPTALVKFLGAQCHQ